MWDGVLEESSDWNETVDGLRILMQLACDPIKSQKREGAVPGIRRIVLLGLDD
jgi:hypothetical protein